MATGAEWRRDPMVRLEKRLYPLHARLLCRVWDADVSDKALSVDLRDAANRLRGAQSRYFDALDISLGADTGEVLSRFASRLDLLAGLLDAGATGDLKEVKAQLSDFPRHLEAMLDTLRENFIGTVLDRQARARQQSQIAAREVAAISRQIYFISINASVEAARAGEAGLGFAAIGEQIRSLSQDTATALNRMKLADQVG